MDDDDLLADEFEELWRITEHCYMQQEGRGHPSNDTPIMENNNSVQLSSLHLISPIYDPVREVQEGVMYLGVPWMFKSKSGNEPLPPEIHRNVASAAFQFQPLQLQLLNIASKDVTLQQSVNCASTSSSSSNNRAKREIPFPTADHSTKLSVQAQPYDPNSASANVADSACEVCVCEYFARENGDFVMLMCSMHSHQYHTAKSNVQNSRAATAVALSESQHQVYSKTSSETSTSNGNRRSLHSIAENKKDKRKASLYDCSIPELQGRISAMAKDQNCCRFLQHKCLMISPQDRHTIFLEIRNNIVELVSHRFGNYLVQKLLEVCDKTDKMEILRKLTESSNIIHIAIDLHGTRSIQKLIETLDHTSHEQVSMLTKALNHGVVTLIKDINGNHVIQRCLEFLSNKDNQFIYDAASAHCLEIATDSQGCCILKRVIDSASPLQQRQLIAIISNHALELSIDMYGNYIIQHVITKYDAGPTIISRLHGKFAYLAKLKSGSNVVEKCLTQATHIEREIIVREFLIQNVLKDLLQHQFGNYVVQCAYKESKGAIHYCLHQEIRRLYPEVCNDSYARRALNGINWIHSTSSNVASVKDPYEL